MRVLMLGWEYPPFISGGLGTACYGLTQAMIRLGTEILFVLPAAAANDELSKKLSKKIETFQSASSVLVMLPVMSSSLYSPYQSVRRAQPEWQAGGGEVFHRKGILWPGPASVRAVGAGTNGGYDGDLIDKVWQYADRCAQLTQDEFFDVIHAHDWMTFPAGVTLAKQSGRSLVVHVHATEFDRSGDNVNQDVYEIERYGMHASQAIIAVSRLTKRIIVEHYGIAAAKVRVIHNGIDPQDTAPAQNPRPHKYKTVLFLGRITWQKGPGFFVAAASHVLRQLDGVRFVIAGWGDLAPQMVEQVAAMGLGREVVFTGFLQGEAVPMAYRTADVYVMPSVSEPFGLTALEAVQYGVPIILSKSSGVAELLVRGAMKVDFWDTELMAKKIVTVLTCPEVAEQLRRDGLAEIRPLTWDAAARKCVLLYRELLAA